ncbi:S14 domain and spectrin repeat-containing protein 1 [Saguinus oedipus]|uniref:S14 domain and spectrin repeat-containing protein 1 n=1 Tax=Saguinus oedipus TaxID=9490 RepID=A0ABQ9VJE7_SAGOE|nr:S14 domain and spectrin repeat-containing protein 1 [Saguinus oedipus]
MKNSPSKAVLVILVSANKLTRYIEPCQLTEDFGGSLTYDHMDWLNKRLVFEKFTKESTSLLDELALINNGSDKGNQQEKESSQEASSYTRPEGLDQLIKTEKFGTRLVSYSSKILVPFLSFIFFFLYVFRKIKADVQLHKKSVDLNFLPSVDPETVLQTGHELLSELQQRRFNGSDGGVSWSPMDDELLAQPQVMKLLDSLREQYTRYQEVCRQRSKRTQLEEIQQKVMQGNNREKQDSSTPTLQRELIQKSKAEKMDVFRQVPVVNWLEGPGSEQLRAQWGIGDSIRASQALQQKHEEIESQHSDVDRI